jgi:CspA family cold shock protein
VVVVSRGTVISFDRIKGYGFVAPNGGGEDVFVHVNDLFSDKALLAPGSVVEYSLEEGERGPKASAVTVVQLEQPRSIPLAPGSLQDPPAATAVVDGEELCDVLSAEELKQELTEALLRAEPPLTGQQILDARQKMLSIAKSHGWTDR